jgi:Glycosyl transferase family 2
MTNGLFPFETPRVAVVIPAHNSAATLDAALASVAGQMLRPCEAVVVDDGSSDDTLKIAARWRSHLPLEVVALPQNGGPGRARHAGVGHTTSPLLAFLDADDVWLPDHLAVCVSAYEANPGVIGGRGIRWRPGEGIETPTGPPSSSPPRDGQLGWILRKHSFGTPVVLARSVYDDAGGFDPTLEGVEDWDLWIRVVRNGVSLQRMERPTFLYRQHAGNLSKNIELVATAGLRMFDRLEAEMPTAPELRANAAALRDARARTALTLAHSRLESGDLRDARKFAFVALRGSPPIALRGAVVAIAPGWRSRVRMQRQNGHGPAPSDTAPSDTD